MKNENDSKPSANIYRDQSHAPEENNEDYIKSHWNKVYDKSEIIRLGWYEKNPQPSLELIETCELNKNATILNVGAGATSLVDELLSLGYNNIIANDISAVALEKLKDRLGQNEIEVKWIVDDLTRSKHLEKLEKIELWHDRAVLHFFNSTSEQDAYFNLLKKLLILGGYVIIATFNLNGASKCSGLPVFRYNANMLAEKLGSDFTLLKSFDYTYIMPSGDSREYIYTLFTRNQKSIL